MKKKADVWEGTLALMVLKTLETMGRSTASVSRVAFAGRRPELFRRRA
jgi:hypothetical protein